MTKSYETYNSNQTIQLTGQPNNMNATGTSQRIKTVLMSFQFAE